jgi:uncharacterized damage-inducible protein DinB
MTEQSYDPGELLAHYAECPRLLREVLAGLGEVDLDRALAPGSWTIRQIAHHIVDGDDLWKACAKAALGNSSGVFTLEWYWTVEQDLWAERWNYAGRALEPSLALFEANRRHMLQLLEQVPQSLERSILIRWPGAREQEVPVWWVVEMQTRHVEGHIGDIQTIRQAHGL